MDRIEITGKAKELFAKYKYVLLILCIGIFMMQFPVEDNARQQETAAVPPDTPVSRAEELEEILGQIAGVGRAPPRGAGGQGARAPVHRHHPLPL